MGTERQTYKGKEMKMAAAGCYVVLVTEKASLMSTNSSQRQERERH